MAYLYGEVLTAVCEQLDTADLISLSQVSHELKTAAQSLLFKDVCVCDPKLSSGNRHVIPTYPHSSLQERLLWLHRSLSLSPELGSCIQSLRYQVIDPSGSFGTFSHILHSAKYLQELHLYVTGSSWPTMLEHVANFRTLFATLSFQDFTLYALRLECIMFIPDRPFRKVHLVALVGPGPPSTEVDLSNYRITARDFKISGFDENFPRGLGSSFWYASSLLHSCLRGPTRFKLVNCPVPAKRIQRLLKAIGQTVESLSLLPSRWLHDPSSAREFSTIVSTFNWSSLLPKVQDLEVNFLCESMASLMQLRRLKVVGDRSLYSTVLANLTGLLSSKFAPRLEAITFGGISMVDFIYIPDGAQLPSSRLVRKLRGLKHHILQLGRLCEARRLTISPSNAIQSLAKFIEARLLLTNTNLHLLDVHSLLELRDGSSELPGADMFDIPEVYERVDSEEED